MAKELYSPKQEVAEKQLVELQNAITKIKELIISGGNKEEIQKVINEYSNKYKDKATQLAIKKTLTNSANKMMYQYRYNTNVINQTFIQQTVKSFKLGSGMTLKDRAYTVDLNAIYNEYLSGNIGQRKCVEEFRNTLNNAKKGLFLMRDYDKLVKEQVRLLASEPVKYVDKNGKALSLRNKVEMAVRYQANMSDVANLKNEGVKLVWCSSHADASPRCSKWQGKLYSLDGTSGTIDGIRYEPLDNALNDNGGNSIINGYNCRHYLIEYEKGSVSPQTYTSKEIQKEYKIDQQQRNYENRIRHLKTDETLFKAIGDIENAKLARQKYIKLNKAYQQYSIKNGRAYYPWRTQISEQEKNYYNDTTIMPNGSNNNFKLTNDYVIQNIKQEYRENIITALTNNGNNTASNVILNNLKRINPLYEEDKKDLFVITDKKHTSYDALNGKLNVNPELIDSHTLYHELYHQLDFSFSQNSFNGASNTLKINNKTLSQIVSKEYKQITIETAEKIKDDFLNDEKELRNESNNLMEINKNILKNINNLVSDKQKESEKYEEQIWELTLSGETEELNKILNKIKKIEKNYDDKIENLQQTYNQNKEKFPQIYDKETQIIYEKWGGVADCVSACTDSQVTFVSAHPSSYWLNGGKRVKTMELFAQMGSDIATNNTSAIELYKKYFPQSFEFTNELIEEINRKMKEFV